MGYMRHHAIVVTSWNEEALNDAHKKAGSIFGPEQVTNILPDIMNGYRSFMIGPDGSKERWKESDIGDKRRDEFIDYCESVRLEDRSTYLDWVEVQYGDDEKETRICRDSDAIWRNQ